MDDSKTEIVEATRKALEKHGYTELSIQKIANEFPKSKSLLYHHYDSKDEILLDFMDQTLENFTENCIKTEEDNLKQELMKKAFIGFRQEQEMTKAMIEIRAQGIRDKRYRKRFDNFSKTYKEAIQDLIKEYNLDDSVEPEKVAMFIDTINKEAMFLRAEGSKTETLEKELEDYIKERIPI